jgi:recombination protein RecT
MPDRTVRDAAENTPAVVTPQQAIKLKIGQYGPVITKLLAGTGVSQETFIAQIANACRARPALWDCNPDSVLGAALRAAQLGLAPNDSRNLAWILPYGPDAQFQLGYGGVMELARRAVPGLRFDGRPVYPNDEFDLDYGKAEPLTHRPAIVRGLDRGGDPYAWYVRATFPDGAVQIHVLDREGVEYHRNFSKQKQGEMWTKSYDAAALKSVVMDMRRWLPSSPQLAVAMASDETVIQPATAGLSRDELGQPEPVAQVEMIEATHAPDEPPLPDYEPDPAA